jgi:hypothetical protein
MAERFLYVGPASVTGVDPGPHLVMDLSTKERHWIVGRAKALEFVERQNAKHKGE